MKIKAIAKPLMTVNKLILLLLITTFAMSVIAAPAANTSKKPTIAEEMKLAKDQSYDPPRNDGDNCA